MLDVTSNQPSKFRTKNWVEINGDLRRTYKTNCLIGFKTSILKSSLCNCSGAYKLSKGTITVPNTAAAAAVSNNGDKEVIFKNCAPFTDCISEISNTQADNAKGINVVMLMYDLIEYSNNYSKTSRSNGQ